MALPEKNVREKIFFFLCVLFFAVSTLYTAVLPELSRSLPVEVDDSINYILRGVQLRECPLQTCKALEDVRKQIDFATTNKNTYADELEEYDRLFPQYTILHSASLAALNWMGLNWIDSYKALKIVGEVLFVAGVAIWLQSLFGWVAAGWAAVLVALTYFVGQGYIWMVPGSMSTAISMIAWGLIVRSGRRHAAVILLLIIAAILMHSLGRGFAVLSVLMYLVVVGRPREVRDWIVVIGGLAVVVAYTVITHVVTRPTMSLPLMAPPILAPSPLDVIKNNILETPRIMGRTIDMVGGLVPALIALVLGVMLVAQRTKVTLAAFLVLLGGLAGVGLLHVWPRIPAELFTRLWMPLAILISGTIAFVYKNVLISAFAQLKSIYDNGWRLEVADRETLLTSKGWMILLVVGTATVMTGYQGFHVAKGLYANYRAKIMITGRQDYSFDSRQVKRIMNADGSCGTIAYTNAWVMHPYFVYGAMKCGALFLPFAKRADGVPILPVTPSYAVAVNPIRQWSGAILLGGSNTLTVTAVHAVDQTAPLRVLVENDGARTSLHLRNAATDERNAMELPAGLSGWLKLPVGLDAVGDSVILRADSSHVRVKGVRRGDASSLHWPWDQGLELAFRESVRYQYDKKRTVSFATDTIFPKNLNVTVLDDNGLSILADVQDVKTN